MDKQKLKGLLRAVMPELCGAVAAVIMLLVVVCVSYVIGSYDARRFTAALITAAITFLGLIVLVTVALVGHAREATSVSAFIFEPVKENPAPWRRGMVFFLTHATAGAVVLLLMGIEGI
jgi:hypothetical protein